MKNINKLIEKQEIHDYLINHVWQTPEFKQNYKEHGIIWQISEDFARLPRFFFDASDESEKSHFSTWWGGIQRRTYDNPYIADLYYLHELRHAGKMPYGSGLSFESFSQKMVESELDASVMSEIRIYFEIPGLREKTFPYEIYADRFLKNPGRQAEWNEDSELLIAQLRLKRQDVMNSVHPSDASEKWIHYYGKQNAIWNNIWYHRYNEVEAAMARLTSDVRRAGRQVASDQFHEWLTSDIICEGGTVPFPDEATAFAGIYSYNKKVYEKEHKKQQATAITPDLTRVFIP